MTRAAYHRHYYRANAERLRIPARLRRRRSRWVQGVVRVICEAIDEARQNAML